MLTDIEVLATFMEPLATIECTSGGKRSLADWWRRETEWSDQLKWAPWKPAVLTLDGLRKIEARLAHEQVGRYIQELYRATLSPDGTGRQDWRLAHASAEQKITALARVLRPLVAPEETQEKQG